MKKIKQILSIVLMGSCLIFSMEKLLAQGLINNGAKIVITNGSYLYIDGSSGNYKSQSDGVFTNTGSSNIIFKGSWVNNSSNTGFNSTAGNVKLAGSTQAIGGSNSTTFYNLDASGSGTATISGNITVSNIFNLGSDQIFAINGNTLTLDGSLTGTGKIAGSGSSNLIYSGGSDATLYFDASVSGTSNSLNNFTYDCSGKSLTLGNALFVKGLVNPTAGTLVSGGYLTLVSDASGTAMVTMGSGNYLSGNVKVERFIPAGTRRFRFLSSPISGSTLNGLIDDIYITGSTGAAGGFDVTSSNAASAFKYEENVSGIADNGWTALSNTSDALTVGRGFRIMVRGDRSDAGRLNGSVSSQNAVTLDLTGAVNSGDLAPTFATYTVDAGASQDGWNLMGNPYPSNIDWNLIYDNSDVSNANPTMYQRDAVSGTYVSYNAGSNSGTGSSIVNAFGAFFLQFTGTPAITFKEARKTSTAGPAYFKNKSNNLLLKMAYDSSNFDLLLIKFTNSAKAYFDPMEDSRKLKNESMNLYSASADMQDLCTDLRNESDLQWESIIPLTVNGPNADYQLRFDGINSFNQSRIFLEDKFLNTLKEMQSEEVYSFSITENALSKNQRFNLLFKPGSSTGEDNLLSQKASILLFPNPATTQVNLSLQKVDQAERYQYNILNFIGQKVKSGELEMQSGKTLSLSIMDLSAGIYFIQMDSAKHQQVLQFVKY